MAIDLTPINRKGEKLKLISMSDPAINWDLSLVTPEEFDVDHDADKLRFHDGQFPTVFVFEHPKRIDIAREIRTFFARALTEKEKKDLFTQIFNKTFAGTCDGGEEKITAPPRYHGTTIVEGFFQAMEDKGILVELGNAFMSAANVKANDSKK